MFAADGLFPAGEISDWGRLPYSINQPGAVSEVLAVFYTVTALVGQRYRYVKPQAKHGFGSWQSSDSKNTTSEIDVYEIHVHHSVKTAEFLAYQTQVVLDLHDGTVA